MWFHGIKRWRDPCLDTPSVAWSSISYFSSAPKLWWREYYCLLFSIEFLYCSKKTRSRGLALEYRKTLWGESGGTGKRGLRENTNQPREFSTLHAFDVPSWFWAWICALQPSPSVVWFQGSLGPSFISEWDEWHGQSKRFWRRFDLHKQGMHMRNASYSFAIFHFFSYPFLSPELCLYKYTQEKVSHRPLNLAHCLMKLIRP